MDCLVALASFLFLIDSIDLSGGVVTFWDNRRVTPALA